MKADVSRTHEQVSERWIFADDGILSFKPHDTGVFRKDIDINVLWPGQRRLLASPAQQPPGVRTLESLQSIFHISMKTHDKHRFQLSIELNLELTCIGLHLNSGCEIVGVVQTLRGHHIVGFNVYTTQTSGGCVLRRTTSVPDVYNGRHLPSFTSFTPPSHRSPPTPLHPFS